MKKLKKLLFNTSNCDDFYIIFFSGIILISFIMWVVAFVINPDGKQINLFFASMQDFLADASNTTGLSSRLDPYHDDTIGLWNAAYPPLAYLLFYFFSRVGSISSGMPYLGYYIHPVWLMFFIISVFVLLIVLYSLIVKQLNMYRGTVAVFLV